MSEINKEYKVKVNDFEFSFTQSQIDEADLIQKSASTFNLLLHHKSFNAVLIDVDHSGKKQNIEINGQQFEVDVKDELDLMLDKMGFSNVAAKQVKEIKAPMPGLVLEVAVAQGQQVQEGEKLLILVAMKMENAITISTDATIKRIAVAPGEAVEKGQLLVELE